MGWGCDYPFVVGDVYLLLATCFWCMFVACVGQLEVDQSRAGADGITPLGRLLHKCLERVLYDPTLDPLEALADALLPLILAERGTYERIGAGVADTNDNRENMSTGVHSRTK